MTDKELEQLYANVARQIADRKTLRLARAYQDAPLHESSDALDELFKHLEETR